MKILNLNCNSPAIMFVQYTIQLLQPKSALLFSQKIVILLRTLQHTTSHCEICVYS